MDESVRIAAVQKILDDRDRLLLKRLEVRQRLFAVTREDNALERALFDLKAAGRVFDQVVAIPMEVEAFDSLESLQQHMTQLRRDEHWEPGKSKPHSLEETKQIPMMLAHEQISTTPKATIADWVMEYLFDHQEGAGATEIRNWLAEFIGIATHEKTVGMTLYRLSKQGIVRREGRKWFPVTTTGDSENPGGDTPGLLDVLK